MAQLMHGRPDVLGVLDMLDAGIPPGVAPGAVPELPHVLLPAGVHRQAKALAKGLHDFLPALDGPGLRPARRAACRSCSVRADTSLFRAGGCLSVITKDAGQVAPDLLVKHIVRGEAIPNVLIAFVKALAQGG